MSLALLSGVKGSVRIWCACCRCFARLRASRRPLSTLRAARASIARWSGRLGGLPGSLIDGDGSAGFESLVLPEGRFSSHTAEGDWRRPKGPVVLAWRRRLRAAVLRRRLKEQSFAVNYRGVELEALYDVGLAIASMLNLEQLGEEILLRAVSLLDARRGALYLRVPDDWCSITPSAVMPGPSCLWMILRVARFWDRVLADQDSAAWCPII